MSKRVANTKSKTARNGRIRAGIYRKRKIQDTPKDYPEDLFKVNRVSLWTKIKNYIRRRRGKS